MNQLELRSDSVSRASIAQAPLVSVAIATYRRPALLRDALLGLREQHTRPGDTYEVMVIDNDPDGSAKPILDELQHDWPSSVILRYVHEKRTGVSFARNRAIDEARGEFLAFVDDDMFVPPQWLGSMLACLERTGAACVGGRTLTHWEGEPEPALRASTYELVDIDMGERDRPLQGRQVPVTANVVFRRSVFSGGLRFCTELGRVGNLLLSGEDTELMERLRLGGHTIWYCAGAVLRHRTAGERLTIARVVRQRYWFGLSYALMDKRLYGKSYQLLRALACAGKAILIDVPRWVVGVVSDNPKRRLLARCSLVKQLGYVLMAVGFLSVTTESTSRGAGGKD